MIGVFGGQQLASVHLGFSFIFIASYPSGWIIIIAPTLFEARLIAIVPTPYIKDDFENLEKFFVKEEDADVLDRNWRDSSISS